jgi:hypothetical protein
MGAIKPRCSPRPENLSDHYERDRTYELTGDPSAPFSFSALLAHADGADEIAYEDSASAAAEMRGRAWPSGAAGSACRSASRGPRGPGGRGGGRG